MKIASLPENENQRLAALHHYQILDTLPEQAYDDITRLAVEICGTPISLISLVDENRQWFKSHHGLDTNETPKEYAFCAHALSNTDEVLIVPDSRLDERFANNPLVTGDPYLISYTGVPLVTPEGYVLGSLCVIDHTPRLLTKEQIHSLKSLANQVVALLELRRKGNELHLLRLQLESKNKELEKFAHVVSHDIKTPLSNIVLSSQLLREDYGDQLDKNAANLLDILKRASSKIKDLVDGILSYYRSDAALSQEHEEIELAGFFKAIMDILSFGKEVTISYPKKVMYINTGRALLEQIFLNLLSNAVKYNDKDIIEIDIDFSESFDFYNFSVSDNGKGIREKDHDKIFSLFTTLGEKDRFGNTGTGIGLSIVKKLVENQGGIITVDAEDGKGATFEFSLKKQF